MTRLWHDFFFENGDPRLDTRTALHRYKTACSALGCHQCTNPDCPYADFIRHCWNHPQCD